MPMKFATVSLMLTCLIFENVCNSFGTVKSSVKPMKTHYGLKRTSIVIFQENPAARMQDMYQSEDRYASLSSRLFKRIRQPECKQCLRAMVGQDPCHRHFYRESGSQNENSKTAKSCILTFVEISHTKPTTTKGHCGG